jgi:hypothetical protein
MVDAGVMEASVAEPAAAFVPTDAGQDDPGAERGLRAVSRVPLPEGHALADIEAQARPDFEWVDPRRLFVEEHYQRDLTTQGHALIRRIVSGFSWRRLKPPVVARDAQGRLVVIDGQHTAIAAASHPGCTAIPVMVVGSGSLDQRAADFVGHNRDRIALRAEQLFWADAVAGNEDVQTSVAICARLGIRILRAPPSKGVFRENDLICTSVLLRLVKRRSAMRARIVLEILARARLAPVKADLIEAVDMVLHDPAYSGTVVHEAISHALIEDHAGLRAKAQEMALIKRISVTRALAIVLYHKAEKRR